jgi:hypothetical protein
VKNWHETAKTERADAGAHNLHAAVETGDGANVFPPKAYCKNLWFIVTEKINASPHFGGFCVLF